jgi:serine/threonine protein kinase
MRIKNAGRGIHQREIVGVDKLKSLPSEWYAFTNLELYLSAGETRENDVFAVIEDRILLIDLKDWNGKIEGDQGGWFHNNRAMPSPVEKVRSNARKLAEVLRRYVREQSKKNGHAGRINTPFVQGCVVVTGNATLSGIGANDRPSVFAVDELVNQLPDAHWRNHALGVPHWTTTEPLTESSGYWRNTLGQFFNIQTGPFRPSNRLYGNYRALFDAATYEHRAGAKDGGVYSEYDVEEDGPGRAPGLLRVWDFTRAATRFQTEEGRHEIAGREREVIAYLKERNSEFDVALLQPKIADEERSVNYWEVFEKRRQLQRLRDLNFSSNPLMSDAVRLDLARGLIQRIRVLHDLDATHLDIGPHSVWFELPSSVKVSHLFAASFPSLHSLGEHRYQFLTAGWHFPEDSLGDTSDHKRRDVFLLGATIHQILFGALPESPDPDSPPDWNSAVDTDDRFTALHGWFASALSWDVTLRFPDASAALDGFNAALSRNSDSAQAFTRLERFRLWRDQFDLIGALPIVEKLKHSERNVVWRSIYDGKPVVVKLWKRICWEDDRLEAPRILDFLQLAERLATTPPTGTARIIAGAFLGDSVVLIQEYVAGISLDEDRSQISLEWRDHKQVLEFFEELITIVNQMHDARIGHGDLKPQNIVVCRTDDKPHPVLVDLLEFSAITDGEVVTTAYAPEEGGSRFERDRFATIRMVEEAVVETDVSTEALGLIAEAARVCREGPPRNATLLPMLEAIGRELRQASEPARAITISLGKGAAGVLLSDEGVYAVRVAKRGTIVVRGASEEIEMTLSSGRFTSARRRSIDQGSIARTARFEIFTFAAQISVNAGDSLDLSALDFIIDELNSRSVAVKDAVEEKDDDNTEAVDDDQAEDELVELAFKSNEKGDDVDVPRMWQSLIDVEQELFTEGVAAGESVYRPSRKRHLVPFDLERGSFDFARHDKVIVERPRRGGGGWSDLGLLDVDASITNAIVIDATGRPGALAPRGPLIHEGDKLRFRSLLETYSRSRRETATRRILSRQSTLPEIVDYFNLRRGAIVSPKASKTEKLRARKHYALNDEQERAFEKLLQTSGLGLLQGPPGTGKTKFIASFVHHVLANDLVRNVLLASQSHEAVNNAAGAIMELFRSQGDEPRFVRVGQEGAVSSELRPFHSDRVEAQYKDRFRAELRDRMRMIGSRLNLEPDLVEALTFVETAILPVVENLKHLVQSSEDAAKRISSLKDTIESLAVKVSVPLGRSVDWSTDDAYNEFMESISRSYGASDDRVRRFLAVSRLSRDWLGSVSTRQRSFETFLAGTRSIVAGTCVGLGRSSLGLTQNRFDLVVIDEAARCTASELAVPMQSGSWILLVGDQFQLEPHHRPDVVQAVAQQTGIPEREIIRSDFERVFHSDYGKVAGHTLRQQYRMLPSIGRVVSKSFYGGALLHERTEPVIPGEVLPPSFDLPLLWVSTDALGAQAHQQSARDSRSLTNESEADAIIELLKELDDFEPFRAWLNAQEKFQEPIGIICTYAAQRDLIRRRLPAAGLRTAFREKCKVDTVDSYQGKENPIVILSLVRNNADGPFQGGRAAIRPGFMSRPNRINVALSRAMDRLVIVGSMGGWKAPGPMAAVVEAFTEEQANGHARVINAASLKGASRGLRGTAARRRTRKQGS